MSVELKDKLYTSTQVAEILGVSLRTLYRYMEDGKIQSMRTASGRHRFTRDHILEFLNANQNYSDSQPRQSFQQPQQNSSAYPYAPRDPFQQRPYQQQPEVQQSQFQNRVVDTSFGTPGSVSYDMRNDPQKPDVNVYGDLPANPAQNRPFPPSEQGIGFEKKPQLGDQDDFEEPDDFRPYAPQRFSAPEVMNRPVKEDNFDPFSGVSQERSTGFEPKNDAFRPAETSFAPTYAPAAPVIEEQRPVYRETRIRYFRSEYTDLIDLAKRIKDTAQNKDLEYAFTLYAGLSLHTLIKPFTILHFYANPEDMNIWKDELRLGTVDRKEDSNVGILINTDIVFVPTKEIGGFRLVEDKVLLQELREFGEDDLFKLFRERLTQ